MWAAVNETQPQGTPRIHCLRSGMRPSASAGQVAVCPSVDRDTEAGSVDGHVQAWLSLEATAWLWGL